MRGGTRLKRRGGLSQRCALGKNQSAAAKPSISKGRSIACRASSRRPRRRTGTRAGAGGTAAGSSPVAAGPGEQRRCGRRDPPGGGRDHPATQARKAAARLCRDHAGRGDAQEARSACRELEEISARYESGMLGAMVTHAEGAVDLAEGDARAALLALRHAWQVWQELEVPYEAARVRCSWGWPAAPLGDDDTAALELEAARDVFAQLGAAPDLARVDSLTRRAASVDAHGLTPRELQVLRLVAAGRTNKAIAAELVLGERTVDRHVSNIFTKLGVSSRAAATAYAYKQQLV